MTTYAVTAATGHFGRLAVEALIARGVAAQDIVAVVRTPEKAADLAAKGVQVRRGNYDEPESLASALAGVDRLLLVSGTDFGRRTDQHTSALTAAKAAGVQRIAYTSILKADTSTSVLAPEHVATEKVFADQANGVDVTILRNGWYFENYTEPMPQYLSSGAVLGTAGDVPFAPASRADYAGAAAAVLTEDGHAGAVYELGGTAVTLTDLAAAITETSGTKVDFRLVSEAQLKDVYVGAGVPEDFVGVLVDIDRVTAAQEMFTDSGDLQRLLGGPATSLSAAVKAAV